MTPLRNVLLRWLLIPTLAVWALGFATSYMRSLGQADEAYDRTLLASARLIADSVGTSDEAVIVDPPDVALDMLRTDSQDRVYYRVADLGTQRVISGYADLPEPAALPLSGPVFADARYKDLTVRTVSLRRAVVEGGRPRALVVEVAETVGARRDLTRRIAGQSAAIQLVTITLAACLIALGVRQSLWPLRRLRAQVCARHAHDTTPIDAGAVPRDIAPLIHAINAHTERQRELGDAQARFVANASHQLKAPLTVLRAQVEHALMQTEVGAMRDVVARLHDTTDATVRLVGQLLALARSDPGQSLEVTEVDLTTLAHEATFDLLTLARTKRIDLGFEGGGRVTVHGESVLLRELVTNLVHNAINYTQDGGRVTVSVGMRDAHATLRVVDNGPGIAPRERAKVLERFYRIPGARIQGSGLGLAIVKEICARHAISLVLDAVSGGGPGLRVDLEWSATGPGAK